MDRNLGATSATPGNVGAIGLLYQWGRKDPFLGSSSTIENTEAMSTIAWPFYVQSNPRNGTIQYTIENPTTFITYNKENNDWYYPTENLTDHTRWTTSDISKSIYDPCPNGWRVPDSVENGIWSKGLSLDTSNIDFDIKNNGIRLKRVCVEDDNIWFPAVGNRIYLFNSLQDVGQTGLYWSATLSTEYSNTAHCLRFNIESNTINTHSSCAALASGNSVRCVR